jgi:hypothetical protein
MAKQARERPEQAAMDRAGGKRKAKDADDEDNQLTNGSQKGNQLLLSCEKKV